MEYECRYFWNEPIKLNAKTIILLLNEQLNKYDGHFLRIEYPK
jgi:hypothetical protein